MNLCQPSTVFVFLVFCNYYVVHSSRPGNATTTHTCDYIRSVPSELRSASNIGPNGLSTFYQKYTEAYGLPVVASADVPDDALRRACYTLRVLFAGHSGVRNSYYKFSGRVGVIGVNEGTTSIPEHSWLSSEWDDRARGLGATESWPISTGGEENMLCYSNDRYYNEDIFLHELSHGILLLGAKYAITGWETRLQAAYNQAKSEGLWNNTYAQSTAEEYFAEGTQSYFNVNAYSSTPDGVHNSINTRDKLRTYDPTLYQLIEEVFPCNNSYLKRCSTSRENEMSETLQMDCNENGGTETDNEEVTTVTNCVDENVYCDYWAGNGECANYPDYMLTYCKKSCNSCGTSSCSDSQPTNCAYWADIGECQNNPSYMLNYCQKSCGVC